MALKKTAKLSVIALIIAAISLTAVTYAAVTVNKGVTSNGSINAAPSPTSSPTTLSPNIGTYSDSACTNDLSNLNWGQLSPGGTTTQTVYVKNTGTASMTLTLATTDWSPAGASSYLTVSWNKQNTVLAPGESVAATITLTVSSSVTGITTFSNTIAISGTG